LPPQLRPALIQAQAQAADKDESMSSSAGCGECSAHRTARTGGDTMNHAKLSDCLLTGCAVAPIVALWANSPVFALFSHIVLLFTGLAFASCDQDAPFRHPERFDRPKRIPLEDRKRDR
jgi:hypothetical protein